MSDDLTISGGAGGVRADTEAMDAAAARLRVLADRLGEAALRLGAVATDPDVLLSTPLSPGTAATIGLRAAPAAAAFAGGSLALEAEAALLTTRARLLRAADSAAGWAEQGRNTAMLPVLVGGLLLDARNNILLGAGSGALGVLGAVGQGDLAGAWERAGGLPGHTLAEARTRTVEDVEALLLAHPETTDVLTGGLPIWASALSTTLGMPPVTFADTVGALLAVGNSQGFFVDGPVATTPVGGRGALQAADLRGLMLSGADLQGLTVDDHEASRVRVVMVPQADGTPAWIVQIPGTQEWGQQAGGDPSDVTSNLALMAGGASELTLGVLEAMRQAGIGNADPVMLVGHSQGGIAAASLASDTLVRQEFAISAVVTAGSPVARFAIPAETHVLSLEHDLDVVPRLEGVGNPDTPSWTTVVRPVGDELHRVRPGSEGFTPIKAHDLAVLYAETAGMVQSSGDDSAAAFLQAAAPFLAEGQTYQDYLLTRGER